MTTEERFWAKVAKSDGCWNWMGARTAPGWHGMFATDATRKGRTMILAHRYSWMLHFGPVPDGLKVCHACDNAGCVRPDHLWLGTQRANMVDAAHKGRTGPQIRDRSRCARGHEMTPDNVYVTPSTGRRKCLMCVRAYQTAVRNRRQVWRERMRVELTTPR